VDDPSAVCMVNDRYMGTAQIPVPVGDKTYFGCCAMCKQRLEMDATVRTGIDPVSGNRVDKASAVIARNAAGKVFYFENETTLRRYRP
jgi:YHS domain-containing protein